MRFKALLKKLLASGYQSLIQKDKDLVVKVAIMAIPGAYFFSTLVDLFRCGHGAWACGINDFIVILPFYVITTSFIPRINFFLILMLYLLSSAAYLALFYQGLLWLERQYYKVKHRSSFILKRI